MVTILHKIESPVLRKNRIYSNRGQPKIEAEFNTSGFVRASPGGLNDPILKDSSKMGCLYQN